MTWTDDTWAGCCALIDEWWPGDFPSSARKAWRLALNGVEPDATMAGLQRLLHEGRRFRPSVSEVLEAIHRDPSKPTFAEAYRLIYGRGGALAARPAAGELYANEADMRAARRAAQLARARQLHPLVGSFIERQGIDRLGQLPVNDPEWGEKHRRDLEQQWNLHDAAMAGRDVATLAAGGRRNQLGRLDPLAALGRPAAAELEASTGGPS